MTYKVLLVIFLNFIFILNTQAQVKHEIRAAWITTAYGLDWPHTLATNKQGIKQQQEELIHILDKLHQANFNTILFQARTRSTVFYKSDYEPFSGLLTGRNNIYPGYDPLAFVIEECHKRGMECHAWLATIPLGSKKHIKQLGRTSVTQKRKDLCLYYKGEYFLNPGHPKTKQYLMSLVNEIITNYDIDGIHFDYLRYPEFARYFPDRSYFQRYNEGRNLSQWRRDNLTEIVRYIYHHTKAKKPWVKISSSPVGKYDDTARYSSLGWNAYHTVHQDPIGWLGEGIHDQIYPMIYFRGNNFYPFAINWQEQSNGRHVITGLGIYFLDNKDRSWSMNDIERQIQFTRSSKMAGQAYYRTDYIMRNVKHNFDVLQNKYYTYPALVPPMKWLDSIPPRNPSDFDMTILPNHHIQLSWKASVDNDTINHVHYTLYRSDTYPVDINNPENIVAVQLSSEVFIYNPTQNDNKIGFFAVTAIDRYGNESEASQLEYKPYIDFSHLPNSAKGSPFLRVLLK